LRRWRLKMRLKSILINKWRGIPEQRFDLDGKSLVLFGESGTGKSSLIDAVEFLYKDRVGFLEGVARLSTKQHGPHVHALPREGRVRAILTGHTRAIERTLLRPPQGLPLPVADHLHKGTKANFILRRADLLRFVSKEPGERYKEHIAPLLGIADLDALEMDLRRVARAQEGALETLDLLLKDELADVARRLQVPEPLTATEDSILAWAQAGVKPFRGVAAPAKLDDVDRTLEAVMAAVASREKLERHSLLLQLKAALEVVSHAGQSIVDADSFWTPFDDLRSSTEALQALQYRDFLERGLDLVTPQPQVECPFCQQVIAREALLGSVENRLAAAKDSSAAADRAQEAVAAVRAHAERLVDRLGRSCELLPNVLPKETTGVCDELLAACKGFVADLGRAVAELAARDWGGDLRGPLREALAKHLPALATQVEGSIADAEETPKEKEASALHSGLGQVHAWWQSRKTHLGRRAQQQRRLALAGVLYREFVDSKNAAVQGVYDALEGDFTSYMDRLNPGEVGGRYRLVQDPEERASVSLRMDFAHKTGVDPRAYSSEAHLDMLGLCIFLAFARRYNSGFPLLVLDDVLTSADGAHRAKVCALLCQEFADYQFVITTHDRLWLEELKSHLIAYKLAGGVRFPKILKWSLDLGPTVTGLETDWDIIQDHLSRDRLKDAAAACRRTLEAVLFSLLVSLRLRVRAPGDSGHTVRDILEPLRKRMKKKMRVLEAEQAEFLRRFDAFMPLANPFTHFNRWGQNATAQEVAELYELTRGFADLFWCERCGRYVEYFPDARVTRCKSGCKSWNEDDRAASSQAAAHTS
jgi:energy-coupling factor transporter ATP-binding protein EcfA2